MEKNKRPQPRSTAPRRRPPTSNYYRSGAGNTTAQASPFKKKVASNPRIKNLLSRILDLTIIMALLLGLGYSLIVNPTPKVVVDNTFYRSVDNYRDSAHAHLAALRNRNKITFDENAVVSAMMRDFPEISSASVELPVLSQRPIVRIKVAAPSFILRSGSRDYVIDSNGKAVGLTSNYSQSAKLPVVIDESNFQVEAGKTVLSSTDVAFINSLIAQAAKAGVRFDSLVLPAAPAELDAKPTNRPYVVKFYLPGDPALEIGQFLAAMHQFDTGGSSPAQYLDVRVSGKIFYK